MSKLLEIDNCAECRKYYQNSTSWYNDLTGMTEVNFYSQCLETNKDTCGTGIPSWCTLPDADK